MSWPPQAVDASGYAEMLSMSGVSSCYVFVPVAWLHWIRTIRTDTEWSDWMHSRSLIFTLIRSANKMISLLLLFPATHKLPLRGGREDGDRDGRPERANQISSS